MMMGKDTTQKLFIDESRIWNFLSEKIEAANVTSYTFNYMSDKNLIKEFWKITDSTPIRDFSKEVLVHEDDFTRFVDKKQQKIIIMCFIVVLYNLTRSYSQYMEIGMFYIVLQSVTQEFQSIISKDEIQIFYDTLDFLRLKRSPLRAKYILAY